MGLPCRLLLALLLSAACCHGAAYAQQHGGWSLAAQQHSPPPLPPPLASLACSLAGGLCPSRQAAPPQQHKQLWPLDGADWVGLAIAAVALLLAATGGIGGGAVLVPTYMMVLGFSTAGAVALSNITIVGGTLANLAFNTARAHPLHPGRPLIDWDLVMVMEPSTILGALAGGYINKVLPAWLTTVALCLLLVFVTHKMLQKALDVRSKEQRALREALRRLSVVDAEGGDLSGRIPTPLLQPLLRLESGASEGSLPPAGGSPLTSSRSGLMAHSRSAALLAGDSSSGSSGAAGAAAVPPADTAGSAAQPDLEAGAGLAANGSSPMQRAASEPMPIGQAGSRALPMLSPIMDPEETRLGSGERHRLLAAATTSQPPSSQPAVSSKAGQPAAGEGTSPAGRTWPYKDQPWRSSRKGSGQSAAGQAVRRRRWRPHVPWGKLAVLLLLLAGVVGFDILKSLAPCPSASYWLRATAMVPVTLLALLGVRAYLLRKTRVQRTAGYEALEGDVQWTPRSTLLYPALCTFAGLCAGTFGVGGGIIKGPLMLEMGVLPEVAAATSATMIWFTSCSASVVFISFGAVQWDYAAACFALGLLSTVVGQLLLLWVQRHLRSRSLLVFVMVAVLGLSCLTLAAQGWQATLAAARSGTLWRFHDVCGRAV